MRITEDDFMDGLDFVPEIVTQDAVDQSMFMPSPDDIPHVDIDSFYKPYIEKFGIDYVERWKLRF